MASSQKLGSIQKELENAICNEEKNQSIETVPEMTQMIEFVKLVRDIKTSILNIAPYLQKGRGKYKHYKKRYVKYKRDLNQTSRDKQQQCLK